MPKPVSTSCTQMLDTPAQLSGAHLVMCLVAVDTPAKEYGSFGAHLVMVLVDIVDTNVEECGSHLAKCLVDVVGTPVDVVPT
jgi:hypothetical protein